MIESTQTPTMTFKDAYEQIELERNDYRQSAELSPSKIESHMHSIIALVYDKILKTLDQVSNPKI